MIDYTESVFERVNMQLKKFSDADSCWNWPLSKTKAGYGQLTYVANGKAKLAYAHRASFYIANGSIKDGMCICHKCDNPACFNPAHLFQGTKKQNSEDMAKKQRSKIGKKYPIGDRHWTRGDGFNLRGIGNGNSKLSNENVLEILSSSVPASLIAKKFSVSTTTIYSIRNRETWKHINQACQQ